MFSVTKRIDFITQPHGGYVDPKKFKTIELIPFERTKNIPSAYKPIQGLAVDYLTRFMSGFSKEEAFKISLLGADAVFENDEAKKLLENIKGLDRQSITSACKLVCYDTAYRVGPSAYTPSFREEVEEDLILNISILVKRALSFFKDYGPIAKCGFTFEGGYSEIVSSGDGDFLTNDTLWDFKVSEKPLSSKQTLQLLIYYILGYNSIHKEFKKIKKLGIFNPLLNTVYQLDISEISNETFHVVSRYVLGYDISDEPKCWHTTYREGEYVKTDKNILLEAKMQLYRDKFYDTGFRPENYSDGIHDINIDDYWTYYRHKTRNWRPKFSRTASVKFLKHDGFLMFVSISPNGSTCILQGGQLRKIKKTLQYYYDFMPEYGNLILQKFSKYWNALYSISNQLKSIVPDKEKLRKTMYAEYVQYCKLYDRKPLDFDTWYELNKESVSFDGKVHGCIVDLDYSNHIYLNPYDGTVTSYSAPSKYMKYVYKNVASLISAKRPEMLKSFKKTLALNKGESTSLIVANSSETHSLTTLSDDEIDLYNIPVTDTSMYNLSNRMKVLQSIYDFHLIEVWYDDVLQHYELEAPKLATKRVVSILGKSVEMNCGMIATVIKDNGYKDITVQFEDGTIVEHCRHNKFREGKIRNPNIPKITQQKEPKEKASYVGRTAVMNCGFKATVIEDFGCNNITVQFEDGLIRKNCRRDKFREGKIAHRT